MRQYTKQELIDALREIRDRGFIPANRENNHGSVGNTLEDLLGIPENNLPIANASEWELKAQLTTTKSLTTLLHKEPSPTTFQFVTTKLLPFYGWRHKEAGKKYSENEKSFRQTINAVTATDRGFKLAMDDVNQRLVVSFDSSLVSPRHAAWLKDVEKNVGLGELDPQPYWGYTDLYHLVATKLLNCFYVQAERKRQGGITYYHYKNIMMLSNIDLDKFINAVREGMVYIDFDARTTHNHGTKVRLRKNYLPELYAMKMII